LPISFKIKKVLTEEEFSDILEKCKVDSQKYMDDIEILYSKCQELTKGITPADEVHILLTIDDYHCQVDRTDIIIDVSNSKESVIQECCRTKNAIVVQDVSRSFIFNQEIDNFLNFNMKSLLLVPLVDSKSQKLIGIIWTAMLKGNINQYTQQDLDYMKRLAQVVSRYMMISKKLVEENSIEDLRLQLNECLNSKRKVKLRLKQEEEYFATIIHDIRSPMNAVIGFLELLKIQESDNQKIKYLESALESADSMISLINDALDIAKISNGKISIDKQLFSPIEKLGSIARIFFSAALKKQISFFTYYDPEMPSQIVSDYHRIRQIVNNLLSNSLKFTDKNEKIILTIEYIKEKDGLYISVEDTGIGISKEMQEKIFTPYTQESSEISKKYGGTGLGLSISHQLSILLGGKLEMESEKDEGSKFYLTIPCNTPADTPPSIEKDKYSGLNVAVIVSNESKDNCLKFLCRYLEYFGMEYYHFKKDENDSSEFFSYDISIIREQYIHKMHTELQNYLDKSKSLIIVKDGSLSEYKELKGKVVSISDPILPNELDEAILQLITGEVETDKKVEIDSSILSEKEVMVVDDNPINLKFMKEILKNMGATTILARSGDESLQYIKDNGKVDIIFIDKNMPGMDGIEAIREIRKVEKDKDLKIIVIGLTGDSDNNTYKQMIEAGADDILTKPIHINKLVDKIKAIY